MSFGTQSNALNGVVSPAGESLRMVQHAVQFYEAPEFLCDAVVQFATEGLAAGQPVVLIPTRQHVPSFIAQLGSQMADLDELLRSGRLRVLDAEETLAQFMTGTVLENERCIAVLTSIIEESRASTSGDQPIRIFGEMVDILWQAGNSGAALRLENVWNELGQRQPFSLLCAYALGGFSESSHARPFDRLCACHTHVLPAESYSGADEDTRSREVSRLQQRAHALEAEIEHRKTAERALNRAKDEAERASRAKSDFLAIMSHELRTPLNAIFGYEDLLSQRVAGPVTSQQSIYLERIRKSAGHLLELVDQVLHLARIEAGVEDIEAELIDVHEVTRETAESVEPGAVKKGLSLIIETPDEFLQITTDPGKVRQILLNLLSNAVKFTDSGEIRLAMRRNHEFIHVQVSDTGIGIEPDKFEKLFDPFANIDASSRQYGGTGLGLSVSRKLARLLGGDLVVTSKRGTGSTFTLKLPLDTRSQSFTDN